jgi:uncharacterized membrane protein YdjX (TVP38/TMEM64 family)
MHKSPQLHMDKLLKWAKVFPLVVVIGLIILGLYFRDHLTLSFIVDGILSHPSISALVLLALYFVKSISLVIPVALLYISSGLVFTPAEAIGINILGIWIASTVPYFTGRYYGPSLVNKIYLRYPDMQRLIELQNKNGVLFAFILRILSVVPMELGAIVLGALGPAYRPYILGSMLGLLPKMLAYTLLGSTISDPTSLGFIITLTASIAITLGSAWLYRSYLKKQSQAACGALP